MKKIKIGDIVRAKFGAVVFGGGKDSFNIKPYGIVTDIESEEGKTDTIKVKIVFQEAPEVPYKEVDLEVITSTGLIKP